MQRIDPETYRHDDAIHWGRFLVAYNRLTAWDMSPYDLLILEPWQYDQAHFSVLKEEGKTYVAYLSMTEVNEHAAYYDRLAGLGEGRNTAWGSRYINPGHPEVRAVLLSLLERYRNMGFDGLFFDTLDNTGSFGSLQAWESGLEDLLLEFRRLWPSGLFIQNGGLHLPTGICDLVLKESVLGNVDLETKQYSIRPAAIQARLIKELRAYGQPFALLEYAKTEMHRNKLRQLMDQHKLPGLITNLELSQQPKFTCS